MQKKRCYFYRKNRMDVLFSKNQDNIANAIQETLDKYLSIKENFLGLK